MQTSASTITQQKSIVRIIFLNSSIRLCAICAILSIFSVVHISVSCSHDSIYNDYLFCFNYHDAKLMGFYVGRNRTFVAY